MCRTWKPLTELQELGGVSRRSRCALASLIEEYWQETDPAERAFLRKIVKRDIERWRAANKRFWSAVRDAGRAQEAT